jgi:hypothetical protein
MITNFKISIIIITIVFIGILLIWFLSTIISKKKDSYEYSKYESVVNLEAKIEENNSNDIKVTWVYPPLDLEDSEFEDSENITFSYYVGYPASNHFLFKNRIYKPLNNKWYYTTYIVGTKEYDNILKNVELEKEVEYKVVMYVTNTDITKIPRARDAEPAFSEGIMSENGKECTTTCPYASVPNITTDKRDYLLSGDQSNYSLNIIVHWLQPYSTINTDDNRFYYLRIEGIFSNDDNWETYKPSIKTIPYVPPTNNTYYEYTYKFDSIDVNKLVYFNPFRVVIYVGSDDNKILSSDPTYSDEFTIMPFSEDGDPSITITKTNNKPTVYSYNNDSFIIIKWSIEGVTYDKELIFSVKIEENSNNNGGDNTLFLFPGLNIYYNNSVTINVDNINYTGTLTTDTNSIYPPYIFTISPLLPLDYKYDVTTTMYVNSNTEVIYKNYNDTVEDLFEVVSGYDSDSLTITTDSQTYAFGNSIKCSWNSVGNAGSYNIGIYEDDSNVLLDRSSFSVKAFTENLTETFTYSKIYKFACDDDCLEKNGVQLQNGYNYYIGVQVCYSDLTCSDVTTYSKETFTVIECNIIGKIDSCSKSETTLLETDPYARIAYEVNCSYADDISKCMNNQGYKEFDQREIPMTCQYKSNVCARKECPPMSTPYTTDGTSFLAGCITPLNINENIDDNNNYSFNTQPSNKAVSYESEGGEYSSLDYGYPFIAIIEGGTSDANKSEPIYSDSNKIDLTETSKKIAVPGMIDGTFVLLMPVDLQNFHPFIAWRTFSLVNNSMTENANPAGGYYSIEDDTGDVKWYSMYHITSNKSIFNNTKDCNLSNTKTCDIILTNISNHYNSYNESQKAQSCTIQPLDIKSPWTSSCMTSNIWLDRVDAKFPSDKNVNVKKTDPIVGSYTNTSTNNWNAPIDDKQNIIFFGSETDQYGSLYNKNKDGSNRISHMRRWVIGDDKTNSYFWTSGLGGSNMDGTDGVYKVLAEQWPNGPPYKSFSDRGLVDINFSAPIQYGIVPYYDQSNFYLEAYTWNETYSSFKGLGFIYRNEKLPYNGFLSSLSETNTTKWSIQRGSDGGGITNIKITYNSGNKYYMRYNTVAYNADDNYMLMTFSGSPTFVANVFFLQNGFILLQPNDYNITYYLCLNNKDVDKKLYWVKTDATLDENDDVDFTPIMLAMTWPSSTA